MNIPQTTGVRFRVVGKMWESGFLKIVHVTAANTVVMQDDNAEQMKYVSIGDVVEFEIETKFQDFHPLNHYKVEFY